jgi:hypothetical protein
VLTKPTLILLVAAAPSTLLKGYHLQLRVDNIEGCVLGNILCLHSIPLREFMPVLGRPERERLTGVMGFTCAAAIFPHAALPFTALCYRSAQSIAWPMAYGHFAELGL